MLRDERFQDVLKAAGWVEAQPGSLYTKGTWRVCFDTSSWIEVGIAANPRIFDVPVPEQYLERWCLNLIEHLCKTEEEIRKLKAT